MNDTQLLLTSTENTGGGQGPHALASEIVEGLRELVDVLGRVYDVDWEAQELAILFDYREAEDEGVFDGCWGWRV